MNLTVGNTYTVKSSHKFHANKAGVFEFWGGPNGDVVVLCVDQNSQSKTYIAVDPNDIKDN